MVGRVVELSVWLRKAFSPGYAGVAEPVLDGLLRYMYHAGRLDALDEVIGALRRAGYHDAASAVEPALETVRAELGDIEALLAEFRHIEASILRALAKRPSQKAAPVVGGDGRG
ncbi:MAG: hypothetical protein GSR84_04580 [Desulfurococcales archaeon]|nr:hypothetical protein [Desulfurococcales archaeon]